MNILLRKMWVPGTFLAKFYLRLGGGGLSTNESLYNWFLSEFINIFKSVLQFVCIWFLPVKPTVYWTYETWQDFKIYTLGCFLLDLLFLLSDRNWWELKLHSLSCTSAPDTMWLWVPSPCRSLIKPAALACLSSYSLSSWWDSVAFLLPARDRSSGGTARSETPQFLQSRSLSA